MAAAARLLRLLAVASFAAGVLPTGWSAGPSLAAEAPADRPATSPTSPPAGAPATPPAIPMVVAVELASPHRLPEPLVRSALGELADRPFSRVALRDGLARLWGLGLFADVQAELETVPGGLLVRVRLTRRPTLGSLTWRGEAGLDLIDVDVAAGLALGEPLPSGRLDRARQAILARYRQEGYLDARVEVEARSDPATAEEAVTFHLRAGEPARLGEVELVGGPGLPEAEARKVLAFGSGDRYREDSVREGVRALETRLRRDGFLEARVSARPPTRPGDAGRVRLLVDVAPGPAYTVELSGRQALPESALLDRLTFRDSGVVDDLELRASARALETAYREAGYHFVTVSPSLDPAAEPRRIRFEVTEGPRVRVERVELSGLRSLPEERLIGDMQTRPPTLLRRGSFRADVLERDLATLRGLLRAEGFADAEVGPPDLRFSPDRTRVEVVVPVVEGPRLTVGRVEVEGLTTPSGVEAGTVLPLAPGQPWSQVRVAEGQRQLERWLAGLGWPGARVDVTSERRPEGTVTVRYRVTEGERTRIARVLVRGLVLTREATVRRQIGFQPGDPFDARRLARVQDRLVRAPGIASAVAEPVEPPGGPFTDVALTLTERKPWRLDLGLAYDTAEGARAILDLGHDNLFGTGWSASLVHREAIGGEAVPRLQRTELSVYDPWLLDTDWQGRAGIEGERSERIGYQLERLALGVTVGQDLIEGRWRPGLRGRLGYRLRDDRIFDVDPELAAEDVQAGRTRIASLTPAVTWDRRSDRVDPAGGTIVEASLEVAAAPLASEEEFVKGQIAAAWYLSPLPPVVLALAGQLGLAAPFGGSDSLPIEDRFLAGGATTVRGYPENRLGPRDAAGNPVGGNALAVVSLEGRFPLWGWLGGALFVDSGTVVEEVGDLALDAFKTGVGAGLRLVTPAGAIRFDVAYGLNRLPGEGRVQVYVTFGGMF